MSAEPSGHTEVPAAVRRAVAQVPAQCPECAADLPAVRHWQSQITATRAVTMAGQECAACGWLHVWRDRQAEA